MRLSHGQPTTPTSGAKVNPEPGFDFTLHQKRRLEKPPGPIPDNHLILINEQWAEFNREWASALYKHDAPYFHFREWAIASSVFRGKRASHSGLKNNPYATWKLEKLDSLLLSLGEVAGTLKNGTFGGHLSL